MELSKKVIFQADDFGYNTQANDLMLLLEKDNKIINFSVLPNFIKKKEIHWLKNKKVAIHVNLVEGKSLSKRNEIFSLVDRKGNFFSLPIFLIRLFLRKIKIEEIYKEVEAQINFLKKNKITIVELNSHQHLHAIYPISDIFLIVAKKYNIKTIRSYKNIYLVTIYAKAKYCLLKIIAYISEFIFNKKLDLPKTWKLLDDRKTIFMSWEGSKFSFNRLNKSQLMKVIIHPGLPFDKNKYYLKLFKIKK